MSAAQEFHQPAGAPEGEVLPCSVEIEQSLLADFMLYPAHMDAVPELKASHFYWRAHIATFALIQDWRKRGEPVHPKALTLALADTDAFEELEEAGPDYLVNIVANSDPLPRRWLGGYARSIINMANQRDLIIKADTLIRECMNPPSGDTIDAIQARGVAAIGAVEVATTDPDTFISSASVTAVEKGLKPQTDRRNAVHSGVDALDERLKGIRAGELVIAAGRPGMGKSLLANRVSRTACEDGLWVASFQLEMGSDAVAARLLCDLVRDRGKRVFYSHFRDGSVSHLYRDLILDANAALEQWPLLINDKAGLTVDDIASQARRIAKRAERAGNRLGLVVVDHIGLVAPTGKYRGNKVAEMTEISNGLKRVAKDLGCGVLALSQLNRGVENRDDKRPTLSDLRESGSIEQDADAVLLLYREAYYLKQREAVMAASDYQIEMNGCQWKLEINVAKCRDGEPGLVLADIDTATGSIREMGTF